MKSAHNEGISMKKQLRDRKKDRTREEILAVAEKFYSEKPMDDILLEDIAEAAFISRTTIYNYFKDKNDVFFAVGNKVFKELNETIATTLPKGLSGKEQVLFLCAKTFEDGRDNPIVLKITNETFNHIENINSTPESIIETIIKKIGQTTFDELIGGLSPFENFKFEKYFEEPHFTKFFFQMLRNCELWSKAIRKGKKDKTIKNDLEEATIIQYITMLINGLLSEMELRKTASNQTGLNRELITNSTLNLISHFLDNNFPCASTESRLK
jgi:AcrR family transcriptional regulator